MDRPISIGPFFLVLAVAMTGCLRHADGISFNDASAHPSLLKEQGFGSDVQFVSQEIAPTYSIPLDSGAVGRGAKVLARGDARLYRSPRVGSQELYFAPEGSALYVRATPDKKWLEVQLSKGRKAFVQTSKTDASPDLWLAQNRIPDVQRLGPGPKKNSEADGGSQSSGELGDKNSEVVAAIDKLQDSLVTVAEDADRLLTAAGGFQSGQENWPAAKDTTSGALSSLSSARSSFGNALDSLTALSSKLTANEKSALAALALAENELGDAIQQVRANLDAMTDGADWTEQISSLSSHLQSIESAVQNLGRAVARL